MILHGLPMRIPLERRYRLLTVAYLGTIYWLSSRPDLGAPGAGPLEALVFNLGHVPLFAGLAFCVLKSLAKAGEGGWPRYAVAFAASGACGALDEWHQSFVPGRTCSFSDFLFDLAGIGAILLAAHLHARRRQRRRAGGGARLDPRAMPALTPPATFAATGQVLPSSWLLAGSNPKLPRAGGSK